MPTVEEDINKAADSWSKEIQLALNGRFGKDKVGFMLVLATSGEGGNVAFRTSLRLSGAVAFLKELANRVEGGLREGKITQ